MFGLIVILLLGATLGWLGSVVLRQEDRRAIGLNIGLGMGGALLASLLVEGTSILSGVGAWALLAAFIGAIVLVGGHAAIRREAYD
ncbi:GlsB/YeaQ/YmgE family stress response membrane protein [Blastomonas marina]|uniref:GlsB/YeaQ/YmgE family stress response membrane protein n=1 Tax=Blastomonas marina TaxID=1867408 RepID=UPI002AC92921|nr:GlsB/YeaQ/YmgE family stress response membrane protein [Blastomonas marina]WPZ03658.1 GlsB/YeaQ/YmgE family stress response membrane protein [Blastomonas marina]